MENLIRVKCQRDVRGRNMRFDALFERKPTTREILDAQSDQGYPSGGYGGPDNIVGAQVDEGYAVTWYCSDYSG